MKDLLTSDKRRDETICGRRFNCDLMCGTDANDWGARAFSDDETLIAGVKNHGMYLLYYVYFIRKLDNRHYTLILYF